LQVPLESVAAAVEVADASFSGTLGVWAYDFLTGDTVEHRPDEEFEGASTIKVLVMMEALRQVAAGTLDLDEPLTYREEHHVRGSGVVRDMRLGARITVHDAIVLMMTISDNVATNMMVDRVGLSHVNRAATDFGLSHTRLPSPLHFEAATAGQGVSTTTPRELGTLLVILRERRGFPEELVQLMIGIMRRQHFTAALTRTLPYNVVDASGGKKPTLQVASKSGSWPGVRNIVGLFEGPGVSYVLSLMTKDCADRRAHYDNEAALLLPKVSRLVFDRFAASLADS
jgi:beta-lactamase class A